MIARGFTLIELLIVLAILAVLSTAVLPVAEVTVQRQKEQELRIALREMRSAIDAYKRAHDDGRILRNVNSTGYPRSLEVLVQGVEDAKDPRRRKIYFLRNIPKDPMEPEAEVQPIDSWLKRSYASEPRAPKEGEDVFDVLSKSVKVGLNGVPYAKW